MSEVDNRFRCPTCDSLGFAISTLGDKRCTFCDGSVGGNPPTAEEVEEAKKEREGKK